MKTITCILLVPIGIALLLFSCKKNNDAAPDMGYYYFPNQVGKYVVYDVDSIYYDPFLMNPVTHITPPAEYKFQIKEKIESIYTDNQNRPTIKIIRYKNSP